MSGSRSTATARTNPPLSGQESSGATQWAAMNHLQLNDLQIYREKAAGTSRAGVYLLDLTLWSGPQINPEDKERECVLIWECLEMFEPLNNLSLTLRLWPRPIKAIYNCPAMHSLACCPVPWGETTHTLAISIHFDITSLERSLAIIILQCFLQEAQYGVIFKYC